MRYTRSNRSHRRPGVSRRHRPVRTCGPLRFLRLIPVLGLLPALLAGCGDGFTDVEMHLGSEEKVRPYAVLCEPPEAAPGDTVTITLLAWAPEPSAIHVGWKVALDYYIGQYQADEVERRIVDLDATTPIPPPVADAQGFLRQSFQFVVPDSTLLGSTALPDPIRDPSIVELARILLPAEADPTSLVAVDRLLRDLDPREVAGLDPMAQAALFALADRFAARIRFRATLHAGITVDVTRALTIRHSGRLGSPNTNRNPGVAALEVLAIPARDVEDPDDPDHQEGILRFPLAPSAGTMAEVRVPRHDDWTYYLVLTPALQNYTSPFSGERLFTENDTYRWYYFRLDAPSSGFALFRNDPGDETEMWSLDESVRLVPPGDAAESRYRIAACLRDERPKWGMYQTTPGLTVATGEVVFFTAP